MDIRVAWAPPSLVLERHNKESLAGSLYFLPLPSPLQHTGSTSQGAFAMAILRLSPVLMILSPGISLTHKHILAEEAEAVSSGSSIPHSFPHSSGHCWPQ